MGEQALINLRQSWGSMGLHWAVSLLHPGCHALITPHAVVLDAGGKVRPWVHPSRHQSGTAEQQFGAAVADLLQVMDDTGLQGRRLHLVVSDFWARPLVLPFQGKGPGDEEADAALQTQYRRTYGDLMDGWSWCWTAQGTSLLAVAWPTAGLTALRHGLAQRSCVLASARPLSVDIGRAALSGGSSWLAIMERESVTLVREQGEIWEDWGVVPSEADMAESLPLLLARAVARRHDGCRSLKLVDFSGTGNSALLRKTLSDVGWSVRVCGLIEMKQSTACRLSQAITLGTSA